jgi:hypothetical protein
MQTITEQVLQLLTKNVMFLIKTRLIIRKPYEVQQFENKGNTPKLRRR